MMLEDEHPVSVCCALLSASRSGFYSWQSDGESQREQRDRELMPLICDIFWEHKRRYGARRIAEELKSRGEQCGVARVAKLLEIQGLKAIQPKSFRPRTTESRHGLGYSPNLLLDREPPERINEVWVGDITYIPLTNRRFSYLSLLMDLFSRRIVGWSYSGSMTDDLVIESLNRAIRQRQAAAGLIHHSDRGGQYASKRYRAILRRAHFQQSMSRADDCYDNAFMESCFGTVKTELELESFADDAQAVREIRAYVSYYNVRRRHSSLGYLSPDEFETQNSVLK